MKDSFDCPIILVRPSGDVFPYPEGNRFQQWWDESQEQLASLSPNSEVIPADCSHDIPIEEPRLVVDIVSKLLRGGEAD